jgi:hypothetical protein
LDTHGAVDTGAEAAIGIALAYPDATRRPSRPRARTPGSRGGRPGEVDPVGVLAAMRGLAGDRGAVVVMDERVAETFTAPATTWSG